ncbi:TetR family transcriptional regulator [Photobacterium sanctipauli]|uniref:TetR family transcriptional regulator n=1 Tax=Photobacterium sanctipauli TaxID=1342794 RepID=A0A2T3NSY2_9GAMM|nr:TetR/AcrR family transcriptional regulator [Photobacterium sanctipauli]PSW19359.1 TetR family transcriptional regulator [Photobacterium sanctipauli]
MSKQQQILDTALALFARQGIGATTTASIAKQAGVATGTLFHHFPTKQALVRALHMDIKTRLAAAMTRQAPDGALQDQVRYHWTQALSWAQAHPDDLQFMLLFNHDPEYTLAEHHDYMASAMGFLPTLIEQAQQQGQVAPLPLPLVLNFCHHHFLSTARLFAEQPALAQQAGYQEGAFCILWQALQPTP